MIPYFFSRKSAANSSPIKSHTDVPHSSAPNKSTTSTAGTSDQKSYTSPFTATGTHLGNREYTSPFDVFYMRDLGILKDQAKKNPKP